MKWKRRPVKSFLSIPRTHYPANNDSVNLSVSANPNFCMNESFNPTDFFPNFISLLSLGFFLSKIGAIPNSVLDGG
jgi:hypothetical protein